MSKLSKGVKQLVLVVVVLTLGILVMLTMASMRQLPETKPQVVTAPLLNAVLVTQASICMTVTGYGTVEPRMDVQVVPQVSGRVVKRHGQFVAGGFFAADTALVKIDPRDYEIAVEAASANVAQAEVTLAREQAEAAVARQEWRKINPGREPDSILVFREPQVRSAEAQLRSARARLEKARLDLERTEITMPFGGRVVATQADVGQYVTQGQPIGSVYATDLVEISIPLEDAELEWFSIPGTAAGASSGGESEGAVVTVKATFAGRDQEWKGQVVRMKSRVDPKSRLVQVVAQVQDPMNTEGDRVPLLPGSFVEVVIHGKTVDKVVTIPRFALRNGREVWVAQQRERLEIRPVTILRQDRTLAYISQGLRDGDIVITSPLDTITDGMQIRVNLENE